MRASLFTSAFAVGAILVACGSNETRSGFDPTEPAPDSGPASNSFGGDSGSNCSGLECNLKACKGDTKTTLRGKVFDPAGVNPLYNVMVYVPGGDDPEKLPPMKDSTQDPDGITCETCASMVLNPLRSALTDGTGSFVLEDVPVMNQLPIVIQVGKWRRLLHVDVTTACDENAVDDGTLTLPKNGKEGDMPQIAVTTGSLDALECLLRGIGIDDKEFVQGDKSTGHVHLYKGEGGGMGTPAEDFWNDAAQLRKYDMVLLSCEGGEHKENKGGTTTGARGSMHEYLNAGGKVFATHYHYTWFKDSPEPEFQNLANWGSPFTSSSVPFQINQDFPKGQMLSTWLDEVGASSSPGEILLASSSLALSATSVNEPALPWITAPTGEPVYFTVNTPISNPDGTPTDPDQQCGRAVITGLHVMSDGGPSSIKSCSIGAGDLNAQQAALEFLFFDLSACVTNDKVPPSAPK